jgi:hypothetical protein
MAWQRDVQQAEPHRAALAYATAKELLARGPIGLLFRTVYLVAAPERNGARKSLENVAASIFDIRLKSYKVTGREDDDLLNVPDPPRSHPHTILINRM